MLTIILMWLGIGLLGFSAFVIQEMIAEGVTSVIRESLKQFWILGMMLVISLVGGPITLYVAMTSRRWRI